MAEPRNTYAESFGFRLDPEGNPVICFDMEDGSGIDVKCRPEAFQELAVMVQEYQDWISPEGGPRCPTCDTSDPTNTHDLNGGRWVRCPDDFHAEAVGSPEDIRQARLACPCDHGWVDVVDSRYRVRHKDCAWWKVAS